MNGAKEPLFVEIADRTKKADIQEKRVSDFMGLDGSIPAKFKGLPLETIVEVIATNKREKISFFRTGPVPEWDGKEVKTADGKVFRVTYWREIAGTVSGEAIRYY